MLHGNELKIDYSKYEEYFKESEEYKTLEEEFNSVTTTSIESTYKKEIENQIKKDIEDMGFYLTEVSLDINLETGEITNINLYITNEKEKHSNNNISINKIEIGESKNDIIENNLAKQDIEKIKNALKENYNIDYEKIRVNSM